MTPIPTSDSENPTIQIRGLTKFFDGLRAVSDFDMTVKRGELAGLIGPNGAGKTTVMDFGEVIARGTPREIQDDVRCTEAYLGKEAAGVG